MRGPQLVVEFLESISVAPPPYGPRPGSLEYLWRVYLSWVVALAPFPWMIASYAIWGAGDPTAWSTVGVSFGSIGLIIVGGRCTMAAAQKRREVIAREIDASIRLALEEADMAAQQLLEECSTGNVECSTGNVSLNSNAHDERVR